VGNAARKGEKKMYAKFWQEKTEGRKHPGRSRRTWEDIKINFKENAWEAQDRGQRRALKNTVMEIRVP
jgi:hypothetical protein